MRIIRFSRTRSLALPTKHPYRTHTHAIFSKQPLARGTHQILIKAGPYPAMTLLTDALGAAPAIVVATGCHVSLLADLPRTTMILSPFNTTKNVFYWTKKKQNIYAFSKAIIQNEKTHRCNNAVAHAYPCLCPCVSLTETGGGVGGDIGVEKERNGDNSRERERNGGWRTPVVTRKQWG